MSLTTNLIAALLLAAGYISPWAGEQLKSVGLFALSGALTNWLAIHMLFEKVPGLYGSGVIPSRFEEFKTGIRTMIMKQFFTKENIAQVLNPSQTPSIDFGPVIDSLDYEVIYKKLLEAITASSLGPMLAMVGGEAALEPVKQPFIEKLKVTLNELTESDSFKDSINSQTSSIFDADQLLNKVETIIDQRLAELTPKLVKDIIQEMIHKHLGWLVVWGGVFGGLIGLIASYIGN